MLNGIQVENSKNKKSRENLGVHLLYSEIVSRGANLQVSRGLIWGDFFKVASEP